LIRYAQRRPRPPGNGRSADTIFFEVLQTGEQQRACLLRLCLASCSLQLFDSATISSSALVQYCREAISLARLRCSDGTGNAKKGPVLNFMSAKSGSMPVAPHPVNFQGAYIIKPRFFGRLPN
jgi:hypothetical protein